MRTRTRLAATILVAVMLPAAPAHAHHPLGEQIEDLSLEIGARPQDAGLYLRRGELYRLGREWDKARQDYDQAERLDPARVETALCRGALWLDEGDAAAAVVTLDRFLAAHPDHAEALWLRSKALTALGRGAAAIADMDRALALPGPSRPEQYLERARALVGESPSRIDAALSGLDAGIARLGPIVTLESYAVDLELEAGRPAAALARLDLIEAQLGPQAVKRGEIIARAGDLATSQNAGPRVAIPAAVVAAPPVQPAAATALPSQSDASGALVAAVTLTRAPYLQMVTPASFVVRWRTGTATDSRVHYGSIPSHLPSAVGGSALVTEHELTVTGLAPNTRYYYSVGSSTETLAGGDLDHFAVTAPPSGQARATRIWILGDSGQAGSGQNAVRNAYATYTGSTPTDVWLMLGDNAYDAGTDANYQAGLFVPYTLMLGKCALWPTRGNHDQVYAGTNNDYYDLFTLPAAAQAGGVASGTEAYYSFDHGNIHFVCLDSEGSNLAPTGAMAVWLRADLHANDSDWTIAFWHHPPYTKGSHDSDDDTDSSGKMRDMRQYMVPILDSLGVDVALTGHSHSYERSYLLDGHYGPSLTLAPAMILDSGSGKPSTDGPYAKPTLGPAPHQGIVHAVAGSSSHTSGGTLDHPAMYTSQNILGSMVLDVNGPQLTARFIDGAGAVRDEFAIVKGNGAPTGTETTMRVDLRLGAARPNPFRDETRVAYSLPAAGAVRLTVHDAAGRRIATIVDGERPAGAHSAAWNGRDDAGRSVAAGVYFARLEFAGDTRHGKIVLSQ